MVEVFNLGSFPLTTGYTLPNARYSFKTFGALNAGGDNAILFPNFLGGTWEALETYIGETMALDPREYFIILPGQFGNGESSSPSNAAAPFDRGAFPPINVADDVAAQHRLLTERLGVQELRLVLGWSVGALQTYEWAIRYPSMVKRMLSIAGAPRPSLWTRLWLRTVLEEPITMDPAWRNGFYGPGDVQSGQRRQGHGMALTLPPHRYFDDELLAQLGFASLDDFVQGFFEAFMLSTDPNNIVCQSRKARAANPNHGGDMASALGRITAKSFVFAFTGDVMFTPEDCRRDADRIAGAQFREVATASGHLTTFGLFPEDRQAVDDAIREVLS